MKRRKFIYGVMTTLVAILIFTVAVLAKGSSTLAATSPVAPPADAAMLVPNAQRLDGDTSPYTTVPDEVDPEPSIGGIHDYELTPEQQLLRDADLAIRAERHVPVDQDPRWTLARALERRATIINAEHISGVELTP